MCSRLPCNTHHRLSPSHAPHSSRPRSARLRCQLPSRHVNTLPAALRARGGRGRRHAHVALGAELAGRALRHADAQHPVLGVGRCVVAPSCWGGVVLPSQPQPSLTLPSSPCPALPPSQPFPAPTPAPSPPTSLVVLPSVPSLEPPFSVDPSSPLVLSLRVSSPFLHPLPSHSLPAVSPLPPPHLPSYDHPAPIHPSCFHRPHALDAAWRRAWDNAVCAATTRCALGEQRARARTRHRRCRCLHCASTSAPL